MVRRPRGLDPGLVRWTAIAIICVITGCFRGADDDGRELAETTTGPTPPADGSTDDGADPPPPPSTSEPPPSTTTTTTTTTAETTDAASSSGSEADSSSGGDGTEVLLDVPGEVFVPSPQEPRRIFNAGTLGAAYIFVRVEVDVDIATFRTDLPPDGVARWDHILTEISRANQPMHHQRYLFGASARVEEANASRAFNYARVEIAPGPESYIAFRTNYPWQEHTSIHLDQWIDGTTHEQTLELYRDGALDLTSTGPVEYYDPALTTDTLEIQLGVEDADWGLHVSPPRLDLLQPPRHRPPPIEAVSRAS